jgi:hypothetical protein
MSIEVRAAATSHGGLGAETWTVRVNGFYYHAMQSASLVGGGTPSDSDCPAVSREDQRLQKPPNNMLNQGALSTMRGLAQNLGHERLDAGEDRRSRQ